MQVYHRLPEFYVVVTFIEAEEDSFFIGGKPNTKFVRIVTQHLARSVESPKRTEEVPNNPGPPPLRAAKISPVLCTSVPMYQLRGPHMHLWRMQDAVAVMQWNSCSSCIICVHRMSVSQVC